MQFVGQLNDEPRCQHMFQTVFIHDLEFMN